MFACFKSNTFIVARQKGTEVTRGARLLAHLRLSLSAAHSRLWVRYSGLQL